MLSMSSHHNQCKTLTRTITEQGLKLTGLSLLQRIEFYELLSDGWIDGQMDEKGLLHGMGN